MESENRGGFENDGGTQQSVWLHEYGAKPSDESIDRFQGGCSFSRAIENQQLMLDEQRFGDDGSNAAWPK